VPGSSSSSRHGLRAVCCVCHALCCASHALCVCQIAAAHADQPCPTPPVCQGAAVAAATAATSGVALTICGSTSTHTHTYARASNTHAQHTADGTAQYLLSYVLHSSGLLLSGAGRCDDACLQVKQAVGQVAPKTHSCTKRVGTGGALALVAAKQEGVCCVRL
jgi:hypothetical protein